MRWIQLCIAAALAFAASLAAAVAVAADGSDLPPTIFVDATGGYSTYKSELVADNDTGTSVAYGLGVYAGSERNFGMVLERETSTFAFKLNGSSLAMALQDLHLRYRIGFFHVSALVSSGSWVVRAPPDTDGDGKPDAGAAAADYIDVTTSGYGVNTGLNLPVGRRSALRGEVSYVLGGAGRQKAPTAAGAAVPPATTVGPRLDIDLGGSLGLTRRVLDLMWGFRYRSYQLTVGGSARKELMSTTYVGMQAGWSL